MPILGKDVLDRLLNTKDWAAAAFELFAREQRVQEAICIASPSLYKALTKDALTEKAACSLFTYLVRMASRATPFGLFAAVQPAHFVDKTQLMMALEELEIRIRPDMGELYTAVCAEYQDDQLFPRLSVRTNSLVQKRGQRYVLDYVRGEDESGSRTASIVASSLIESILRIASQAIEIETLYSTLGLGVERDKTFALIRHLVQEQFLLPANLPSLRDMNLTCSEKTDVKRIDARISGKSCIHRRVGSELSKALNVLWRISAHTRGKAQMEEYHRRFLERYGTDRRVPLIEIVQEMGPYTRATTKQELTVWDAWLATQWQESILNGLDQITVTDECIDRLPASDPCDAMHSLDVICKIIAETERDIDTGAFQLLLAEPMWQGGSSIGRLYDLIQGEVGEEFQELLCKEEKLDPWAESVDVFYWPFSTRSANVAVSPSFHRLYIELDSASSPLSLGDIYIGATLKRLYVTTKEGDKELNITASNLLNPLYAPEPLRLIREISWGCHKHIYPFSYGPIAEYAEFLPRVVYEKTILFPATWQCKGREYKELNRDCVIEKFTAWQKRWRLPEQCVIVKGDQRLPCRIGHPVFIGQIVAVLKKGEDLVFEEYIDSQCFGGEIAVPFVKRGQFATKQPAVLAKAHREISNYKRWKPPGSEWVYAKLYYNGDADDFIVSRLSECLRQFGKRITDWHFVRYADTQPHVRFRIRSENPHSIMKALSDKAQLWKESEELIDICYASYEREIERYGGVAHISLAEQIFTCDSNSALQLLRLREKYSEQRVFYVKSVIMFLYDFLQTDEAVFAFLSSQDFDLKKLAGYRAHKQKLLRELEDSKEEDFWKQLSAYRSPVFTKFPVDMECTNSFLHMHCNRLGLSLDEEHRARLYAFHSVKISMARAKSPSIK